MIGAPLRELFVEAVARMDPETRVRDALGSLDFGGRSVAAIALGKAAIAMARGAASIATRGLIVAPSSDASAPWPVLVGAHPVPDARSEAAGRALMAFVGSLPASDALLALVSGGGSALAAVPRPGLSLSAKIARVRQAVMSGAPIAEINRVRTSLSAIKGGQLAALSAAPVTTLVCSDVVGDDPRVVGSGPTVAASGGRTLVIAGISDMARAAALAAAARGISAEIIDDHVTGDVTAVAARISAEIKRPGPRLLVFAGEPTLALPPAPGNGGRAQHLALLVARALSGVPDVAFLAAGTDGIDGTGPAAGAIVSGSTWASLVRPAEALAAFDSGTVLSAGGAALVTGATGVNHADLMLLLRGRA
ncbi:MAG TPA: DUF4147 domain-containing protein [Kofleriaceae bacterium]|nr:DUF4147 domain-containing protein [Kofleriaceae bacterium]